MFKRYTDFMTPRSPDDKRDTKLNMSGMGDCVPVEIIVHEEETPTVSAALNREKQA
jgi:hypothetical protein